MKKHCKGQSNIEAARDAAQEKRAQMNEPSPAAKQAAEWSIKPVERKDGSIWQGLAYIVDGVDWESGSLNHLTARNICKMHNTATAKLREETASWRSDAEKDLQEASDLIRRLLQEDVPPHEKYGTRVDARHWLARQQPSAFVGKKPCNRCGVFFFEDEKECPHCSEPRQPSATTPATTADVEELAKQLATDVTMLMLNNQFSTPKCHAIAAQALAQVRAPLVAAVKDAIERFEGAPDNDESDEAAIATYRAAITGTGENVREVKQGKEQT